jgi:hypothetical protein
MLPCCVELDDLSHALRDIVIHKWTLDALPLLSSLQMSRETHCKIAT